MRLRSTRQSNQVPEFLRIQQARTGSFLLGQKLTVLALGCQAGTTLGTALAGAGWGGVRAIETHRTSSARNGGEFLRLLDDPDRARWS